MLRSMYSGIGGMRGFQNKLDVIGNNVANVNTVGFKKSRVMFQDILSQTMAGGNAPTPTTGGTNPKQIGLGSSLSTIDVVHTQGGLMNTGVPYDLAIQGNGFFVVVPQAPESGAFEEGALTNNQYFLTRAGNFSVDAKGNLVTSNGMFVVGIEGTTNEQGGLEGGTLKPINLYKVGGGDPTTHKIESYSIGSNGEITVKLSALNAEEGNNGDNQNQTKTFVGLATVENPGGLEKSGNNLYRVNSSANGNNTTIILDGNEGNGVVIGSPSTKNRGPIYAGQLEMSNVDLAEEFSEMIVAQRGFQANSRIITTSDSILEELVNLKR
jgi:flagellar hook protein FlgE